MAHPLSKKRTAHDPSCELNKTEVVNPKTGKPFLKVCTCGNNPLAPVDYARMNLAPALWPACLEEVTPSVRDAVGRYAARIVDARKHGSGAYFYGPIGVGKSGAAAFLAKEARAWGFTVYCTAVSTLRDSVCTRKMFDAEATILTRCRSVDFLMLDDLQLSDKDERMFGLNEIRNLLLFRKESLLVTLVTSRITPDEWNAMVPTFAGDLGKCLTPLEVKGANRSKNENLFAV